MKIYLKSLFTEHWKYMAVSTACKMNLFEHLQEPKTAAELAEICKLNEVKLTLLLQALHSISFLEKRKDNTFKINRISEFLTENHPDSLKYACMNWAEEHLTAWQLLEYSIQTGKSAFEKVYGKPYFEYLNEHPEKLHAYHQAMYEYARDDYQNLPKIIDFTKFSTLMDIGGGYGALLEIVQNACPTLKCILFDLPQVIKNVNIPNIQKISGNFFDAIPQVADAIILARILHDWNNQQASIILKNCFEALPDKGTLFIIENCTDKISEDLSLLSLNMTVMCESFERSSTEYIELATNAGFQFKKYRKLNDLQAVLKFQKI